MQEKGETKGSLGRVLVVEDDDIDAALLSRPLLEAGFEVVVAQTAEDATKKLEQAKMESRPFDVVSVDLGLPPGAGGGEDPQEGLDLIVQIEKKYATKVIAVTDGWVEATDEGAELEQRSVVVPPQVVVTKFPKGDYAAECREYAYEYVTKPFVAEEYVKLIKKIVEETRRHES